MEKFNSKKINFELKVIFRRSDSGNIDLMKLIIFYIYT